MKLLPVFILLAIATTTTAQSSLSINAAFNNALPEFSTTDDEQSGYASNGWAATVEYNYNFTPIVHFGAGLMLANNPLKEETLKQELEDAYGINFNVSGKSYFATGLFIYPGINLPFSSQFQLFVDPLGGIFSISHPDIDITSMVVNASQVGDNAITFLYGGQGGIALFTDNVGMRFTMRYLTGNIQYNDVLISANGLTERNDIEQQYSTLQFSIGIVFPLGGQ